MENNVLVAVKQYLIEFYFAFAQHIDNEPIKMLSSTLGHKNTAFKAV